jgi:hypothetical protein
MRKPIEIRHRRGHEPVHARRALFAAALAAAAVTAAPRPALAEPVPPTGKGIAGGALLGAELVVFGEALFGVRSGAAYLIGAGAGAVAGGVGGYFLEQAVDDGRIPAYVLAGGLALVIPAVVVALDATRFRASAGMREDRPLDNVPVSDPGQPGGSAVVGAEPQAPPPSAPPSDTPPEAPPAPAPAPEEGGGGGGGGDQGPRSLFDVQRGGFQVGLPVPEVRPLIGSTERKAFGVQNQGSEVRFPVVRVVF